MTGLVHCVGKFSGNFADDAPPSVAGFALCGAQLFAMISVAFYEVPTCLECIARSADPRDPYVANKWAIITVRVK